jgi:hypothetical protein
MLQRDLNIAASDVTITLTITSVPQDLATMRIRGDGSGIYGVVAKATDLSPIPDASVFVAGSGQEANTDSTGQFFVEVKKPGTYAVRIVREGFAEDVFTVSVPRGQVVEASRLLDESKEPPTAAGLWKDFDQRLRWRSVNSALVTGGELRGAGGSALEALERTPSFLKRGLRFGPVACVFVNGSPRPGAPPTIVPPEQVQAIEVYGNDREVVLYVSKQWPRGAPCGETGRRTVNPRASEVVRYVMIWTKR